MPIDATVGGASANSLCTVEFADTYFSDERLGCSDWFLDPSDKVPALIQATRRLEAEDYIGRKTNPDVQALKWPRVMYREELIHSDTYEKPVASDVIPVDVKRACCELAYAMRVRTGLLSTSDLEIFSSLKIGDTTFDLRSGGSNQLPSEVTVYLRKYLVTQYRLIRG